MRWKIHAPGDLSVGIEPYGSSHVIPFEEMVSEAWDSNEKINISI